MEYTTLNNKVKMPLLGFGVFQVDDLKQCQQSVEDALEIGYRLIDTAQAYHNEEAVGKAIKQSGIKREDIFVTTKLWISDANEDKAMKAFETSMKKLGLDYLDLYLIHQPFNDVFGAWRAMEKLYKEGRIRAIGVSNFQPDILMNFILNNEIKPMVNQIETHPFYQQRKMQDFLKENDIQIESWGPFAEGKNNLFTNPLLASIAKKHNKSVAQVVLRWLIQRNVVAIPKSIHKQRIKENFNIFDFLLDSEDMKEISTLDKPESSFINHNDPQIVKWFCSYN
ncbi:MAG: aldo/keto reductase [Bacteroidales bacterium]|jgi:diketogulonate reductase-like aldo/keto reductase|nr:aldo/keto reductase [Bacteroidales bacterium]